MLHTMTPSYPSVLSIIPWSLRSWPTTGLWHPPSPLPLPCLLTSSLALPLLYPLSPLSLPLPFSHLLPFPHLQLPYPTMFTFSSLHIPAHFPALSLSSSLPSSFLPMPNVPCFPPSPHTLFVQLTPLSSCVVVLSVILPPSHLQHLVFPYVSQFLGLLTHLDHTIRTVRRLPPSFLKSPFGFSFFFLLRANILEYLLNGEW